MRRKLNNENGNQCEDWNLSPGELGRHYQELFFTFLDKRQVMRCSLVRFPGCHSGACPSLPALDGPFQKDLLLIPGRNLCRASYCPICFGFPQSQPDSMLGMKWTEQALPLSLKSLGKCYDTWQGLQEKVSHLLDGGVWSLPSCGPNGRSWLPPSVSNFQRSQEDGRISAVGREKERHSTIC